MEKRLRAALLLCHPPLGSLDVNSTFQVKTASGVGTCFIRHHKDGRVFVSAAHLFEAVAAGDQVYLAHESGWIGQTVRRLFRSDQGHDICVFTTEMKVGGDLTEPEDPPLLMPGQPLKFLGYPHGLITNYPNPNGFLSPLVRTAYFSGPVQIHGRLHSILDGFNNPGYSGGPIFACNNEGEAQLYGVVSGFRYERENLGAVWKREGDKVKPVEDYFVRQNSGMIYAVGIGEVNEIMQRVDDYLDDSVS